MTDYGDLREQLEQRLADLLERADVIEADSSEQAIDLADDEPLEGVDGVLRQEIAQIRMALLRIEKGTYGRCSQCGKPIARKRLEARPIATRCVDCAS